MIQEKLYQKYLAWRHRENHPTLYAERFIDFLKKEEFFALLVDIWCGDGRDVNIFAKAWFISLWIDYSEKEISLAHQKFPLQKFEVQNVEKLQFSDNSVWAFFMINVIHYVDQKKALQEIFRTLQPKGYFFIHFNIDITDKDWKRDYYHDPKDILELLKDFTILSQNIFQRTDMKPIEHTHTIMELILEKSNQ